MRNKQVDAWMFLAVAHGRGDRPRATLANLIAAADWINHAIPLHEEVAGGLNRLIAAGLVDERENEVALTPAGETLFSKARLRAGVRKQFERLEAAFESLATPISPTWTPSAATIARAIEEYQEMAAAVVLELTSRDGGAGPAKPR